MICTLVHKKARSCVHLCTNVLINAHLVHNGAILCIFVHKNTLMCPHLYTFEHRCAHMDTTVQNRAQMCFIPSKSPPATPALHCAQSGAGFSFTASRKASKFFVCSSSKAGCVVTTSDSVSATFRFSYQGVISTRASKYASRDFEKMGSSQIFSSPNPPVLWPSACHP